MREPSAYQDYFDLGIRYLSDGNCEEAVIAFIAAVEIDPKQADAYEKLADAYLAAGDTEAALQALRDGCAATGDDRLQARLVELTESEAAPILVDHIEFASSEGGSYEYAAITAYSDTGEMIWNYETPEYEWAQLDRVSEIGRRDDRYYFVQDRSIVAMDVQTGNIIWKNDDFGGGMSSFAFGDDAIYLCGYLGPDFYAVSYDGETLSRIEQFHEKYYWPIEIDLMEEQAAVYLEGGPQDYGILKVYYVNLSTCEVSDDLPSTESTQVKRESWSSYQEILDFFYHNISDHWSDYADYGLTVAGEMGFSYMWPVYCRDMSLSDAGYTFMDLDGNGVPELLVSRIDEGRWGAKEGMIYELYTLQGGKVIHLASSGERNRYHLCKDSIMNYIIASEGSGGASNSWDGFYMVDPNKDKLVLKETVVYDGREDEENPWFYGTAETATGHELTPIGENDALQIINSYEDVPLDLILFDSYTPGQSTP